MLAFRDQEKSLDSFDFGFNRKMNRRLVFDRATGHFIDRHEDALSLGRLARGSRTSLRASVGR